MGTGQHRRLRWLTRPGHRGRTVLRGDLRGLPDGERPGARTAAPRRPAQRRQRLRHTRPGGPHHRRGRGGGRSARHPGGAARRLTAGAGGRVGPARRPLPAGPRSGQRHYDPAIYGPVADGDLLPADPLEALAAGRGRRWSCWSATRPRSTGSWTPWAAAPRSPPSSNSPRSPGTSACRRSSSTATAADYRTRGRSMSTSPCTETSSSPSTAAGSPRPTPAQAAGPSSPASTADAAGPAGGCGPGTARTSPSPSGTSTTRASTSSSAARPVRPTMNCRTAWREPGPRSPPTVNRAGRLWAAVQAAQ